MTSLWNNFGDLVSHKTDVTGHWTVTGRERIRGPSICGKSKLRPQALPSLKERTAREVEVRTQTSGESPPPLRARARLKVEYSLPPQSQEHLSPTRLRCRQAALDPAALDPDAVTHLRNQSESSPPG